ncbi:MAG: MFS family permease [Kiritimatiellia bacterium]|jgi:MFS family permease
MLRSFGDDSALSFAIVIVVKTLPAVIAPLSGVLADRLPRVRLMVTADLLRAVVVLMMVALAFYPSVPVLYGLVVVQTMLSTIFDPARTAMLPDVVAAEDLGVANALDAASWSTMLAIGAAMGGLLTGWLGWQATLLVDAASYLISAGLLVGIAEPLRTLPARKMVGLMDYLGINDMMDGARFMAQRPRLWTLALVKPMWQLAGARTLLLTLLAETVFAVAGWPMFAVTVLYVSRGLGTGLGPILARRLAGHSKVAMERAIGWGMLTAAIFYAGVGLAPNLWSAAVFVVLAHLGGATIWVFSTIRLQQLTPTEVRGRVFAVEHAAFTLVMAGANGVFGTIGDALPTWLSLSWDVPDAVGLSARVLNVALGVLTLLPWIFWVMRGWILGWGDGNHDLEESAK